MPRVSRRWWGPVFSYRDVQLLQGHLQNRSSIEQEYLEAGNQIEFETQWDEQKQKYYAVTVRRYWPKYKGTMVVWICNQGYGWIKPDTNHPDIFVHYKAFDYEDSPISVGSRVCYDVADSEERRVHAIRVCVDPFPPPDPDETLARNMEAITFTKKRRRL